MFCTLAFLFIFLDTNPVVSQTCTWYPDGYRKCDPWGASQESCEVLSPMVDKFGNMVYGRYSTNPLCEEEHKVSSDPHYRSADGVAFDHFLPGEYVLMKHALFPTEVQIRCYNLPIEDAAAASLVGQVAVKISDKSASCDNCPVSISFVTFPDASAQRENHQVLHVEWGPGGPLGGRDPKVTNLNSIAEAVADDPFTGGRGVYGDVNGDDQAVISKVASSDKTMYSLTFKRGAEITVTIIPLPAYNRAYCDVQIGFKEPHYSIGADSSPYFGKGIGDQTSGLLGTYDGTQFNDFMTSDLVDLALTLGDDIVAPGQDEKINQFALSWETHVVNTGGYSLFSAADDDPQRDYLYFAPCVVARGVPKASADILNEIACPSRPFVCYNALDSVVEYVECNEGRTGWAPKIIDNSCSFRPGTQAVCPLSRTKYSLFAKKKKLLERDHRLLDEEDTYCVDCPEQWTDRSGSDCGVYAYNGFCGNPANVFYINEDFNTTGDEACCACGGGEDKRMESPQEGRCVDDPLNWRDSFNSTCGDYVQNGWCSDPANLAYKSAQGVHANRACCACGGGAWHDDTEGPESGSYELSPVGGSPPGTNPPGNLNNLPAVPDNLVDTQDQLGDGYVNPAVVDMATTDIGRDAFGDDRDTSWCDCEVQVLTEGPYNVATEEIFLSTFNGRAFYEGDPEPQFITIFIVASFLVKRSSFPEPFGIVETSIRMPINAPGGSLRFNFSYVCPKSGDLDISFEMRDNFGNTGTCGTHVHCVNGPTCDLEILSAPPNTYSDVLLNEEILLKATVYDTDYDQITIRDTTGSQNTRFNTSIATNTFFHKEVIQMGYVCTTVGENRVSIEVQDDSTFHLTGTCDIPFNCAARTEAPSRVPTASPTKNPTATPTFPPTKSPTAVPTPRPTLPSDCGNQIVERWGGETCDCFADDGFCGFCRDGCTYCGDGVLQDFEGETCDHGINYNAPKLEGTNYWNITCRPDCTFCGDNIITMGINYRETCEPHLDDGCRDDCSYCGDHVTQRLRGEQCDSSSKCTPDCQCGAPESDLRRYCNEVGCRVDCSYCGDGNIDWGVEFCDSGGVPVDNCTEGCLCPEFKCPEGEFLPVGETAKKASGFDNCIEPSLCQSYPNNTGCFPPGVSEAGSPCNGVGLCKRGKCECSDIFEGQFCEKLRVALFGEDVSFMMPEPWTTFQQDQLRLMVVIPKRFHRSRLFMQSETYYDEHFGEQFEFDNKMAPCISTEDLKQCAQWREYQKSNLPEEEPTGLEYSDITDYRIFGLEILWDDLYNADVRLGRIDDDKGAVSWVGILTACSYLPLTESIASVQTTLSEAQICTDHRWEVGTPGRLNVGLGVAVEEWAVSKRPESFASNRREEYEQTRGFTSAGTVLLEDDGDGDNGGVKESELICSSYKKISESLVIRQAVLTPDYRDGFRSCEMDILIHVETAVAWPYVLVNAGIEFQVNPELQHGTIITNIDKIDCEFSNADYCIQIWEYRVPGNIDQAIADEINVKYYIECQAQVSQNCPVKFGEEIWCKPFTIQTEDFCKVTNIPNSVSGCTQIYADPERTEILPEINWIPEDLFFSLADNEVYYFQSCFCSSDTTIASSTLMNLDVTYYQPNGESKVIQYLVEGVDKSSAFYVDIFNIENEPQNVAENCQECCPNAISPHDVIWFEFQAPAIEFEHHHPTVGSNITVDIEADIQFLQFDRISSQRPIDQTPTPITAPPTQIPTPTVTSRPTAEPTVAPTPAPTSYPISQMGYVPPVTSTRTCAGFCGGENEAASCWCDPSCDVHGDCCDDFRTKCPYSQLPSMLLEAAERSGIKKRMRK